MVLSPFWQAVAIPLITTPTKTAFKAVVYEKRFIEETPKM
jgi:hypothetical protein